MKIGVFDSGRGGEAVAKKLQELLPLAEIVTVNDRRHVPYGGRPAQKIITLADAAIQPLLDGSFDTIVIACNTATVVAIEWLRRTYPSQNFVGLEPMIKPAAQQTKTGIIAVLATPATLASNNYSKLKHLYAQNVTVIEPDCSTWAGHIKAGTQSHIDLEATLRPLISAGVDTIVLGCTHYHWLEKDIEKITGPEIEILEPTDAIRNRITAITQTDRSLQQ